jgi:hypothetical protein
MKEKIDIKRVNNYIGKTISREDVLRGGIEEIIKELENDVEEC